MYVREAHALDSRMPSGGGANPILEDPRTLAERSEVASVCIAELDLGELPALVDDLDDSVSSAYAAWPDRLYLVDVDGRIAYHGGRGPFGFDPDGLARAIEDLVEAERE